MIDHRLSIILYVQKWRELTTVNLIHCSVISTKTEGCCVHGPINRPICNLARERLDVTMYYKCFVMSSARGHQVQSYWIVALPACASQHLKHLSLSSRN